MTLENKKPYLIVIYGKDGCDRCRRLKNTVQEILKAPGTDDFAMDYQNLSTPEGMKAYALAETVNGQRIPALQIMGFNPSRGSYVKLADPSAEHMDQAAGKLMVPVWLQLETSYGQEEQEISSAAITDLMKTARTCSL